MSKNYNLGLDVTGIYPLSYFSFKSHNNLKKTYFVEQMLKKEILTTTRYYPNYSQNNSHLNLYFEEAEKIFSRILKAYF